ESRHPLNTARLAVFGLSGAELWVGEHFPALDELLASHPNACLLFPEKEGEGNSALRLQTISVPTLLIVPDGTWRKARQIIRANPVLDSLPRLSLPLGAPSEYRIRRASEPSAVATIEAIVRA